MERFFTITDWFSGGLLTGCPDIVGNIGQVVSELMTSTVDRADNRMRQPRPVERKVSERNDVIIATVVEEDFRNGGKLFRKVIRELQLIEIPPLGRPGGAYGKATTFSLKGPLQ